MKVLILNGFNSEQEETIRFKDFICKSLEYIGYDYELIDLQSKKIQKCLGCFNCWVLTPGECYIQDDSQHILKLIINCDLLIFLTPVVYGGYSSHLKIMLDRIIPLISPFFGIYEGEVHHKPRYIKYPSLLGIGVQRYPSDAEATCFKQIVYRNSLNLHSPSFNAETLMNIDDETTVNKKLIDNILRMESLNYAK